MYFPAPKSIVMTPDDKQPNVRKYLKSSRSAIIPLGNWNSAYESRYVVSMAPRRESAFCLSCPFISSVITIFKISGVNYEILNNYFLNIEKYIVKNKYDIIYLPIQESQTSSSSCVKCVAASIFFYKNLIFMAKEFLIFYLVWTCKIFKLWDMSTSFFKYRFLL